MLNVGERFPDFKLGAFSTEEVRSKGPLVVVFWRIGCSTSRLAIPFFDRLAEAYPNATVVGVCQESEGDTQDYRAKHGLQVLHLADVGVAASNQFDVDVVPTYFATDSSGKITFAGASWNVDLIEDLSRQVAQQTESEYVRIVAAEDRVPLFKPG
jgi:peroxiredoxin